MFFLPPHHRSVSRLAALLVALVLLAAGATLVAAPAQARDEARSQASVERVPAVASPWRRSTCARGCASPGMRHDIGQVLGGGASVIGFQERLFSRPALRARLPKSWTLLMPSGPTGTDDNPIAFDKRVWELEKTWPALLTGTTWRRRTGQIAHDQYGVVAVLRHRRSGHVIRAVSFHLPNHLHNRRTGGPNYANRAGVAGDVADGRRGSASSPRTRPPRTSSSRCATATSPRTGTPPTTSSRAGSPGRCAWRPTTAVAAGGSGIDYVMGERDSDFRIDSFESYRRLVTDHPGIVATFTRVALRRRAGRTGPVASVTLGLGWPRPVGSRHVDE